MESARRATPVAMVLALGLSGCGKPVTPEQLRPLFGKALLAEGGDYIAVRNEVVELGRGAIPLLEETARTGKTWQERCLADILIERIQFPRAADRLKDKHLEGAIKHNLADQAVAVGKVLARRFRKTPMVLLETVWKSVPIPFVHLDRAAAAVALGCLNERRARPVIEAALPIRVSRWDALSWGTLYGLAKLGCHESIPALAERYGRSGPATRRIVECVIGECLHGHRSVTPKYVDRITNPDAKKLLQDPGSISRLFGREDRH